MGIPINFALLNSLPAAATNQHYRVQENKNLAPDELVFHLATGKSLDVVHWWISINSHACAQDSRILINPLLNYFLEKAGWCINIPLRKLEQRAKKAASEAWKKGDELLIKEAESWNSCSSWVDIWKGTFPCRLLLTKDFVFFFHFDLPLADFDKFSSTFLFCMKLFSIIFAEKHEIERAWWELKGWHKEIYRVVQEIWEHDE